MSRNFAIAAFLAAVIWACVPVFAQAPVVIQQSQRYVADGSKVQRFFSYINLKPAQEKLHLLLTFNNGSDTVAGFTSLHISAPNMTSITEKNFKDHTYSVDLTGQVSWGPNQVLIEGSGPKGAILSWTLTATRPVLTGVNPKEAAPDQEVFLNGSNLCSDETADTVTMGSESVPILGAYGSRFLIKVPRDLPPGKVSVSATVCGINAGSLPFIVKAVPEVSGISTYVLSPNQSFTIYGKNFAPTAGQNTVMLGPYKCLINSVGPNGLQCTVPTLDVGFEPGFGVYEPFADWTLPVTVTSGGMPARNKVALNVTMD